MSTTKFVVDGVEVAQTLNNLVSKFGQLCADQKLTPPVSTKSTAATRPPKVWTGGVGRSKVTCFRGRKVTEKMVTFRTVQSWIWAAQKWPVFGSEK